MFVDLDWPLNASSLLSASAELLVLFSPTEELNVNSRTKIVAMCRRLTPNDTVTTTSLDSQIMKSTVKMELRNLNLQDSQMMLSINDPFRFDLTCFGSLTDMYLLLLITVNCRRLSATIHCTEIQLQRWKVEKGRTSITPVCDICVHRPRESSIQWKPVGKRIILNTI